MAALARSAGPLPRTNPLPFRSPIAFIPGPLRCLRSLQCPIPGPRRILCRITQSPEPDPQSLARAAKPPATQALLEACRNAVGGEIFERSDCLPVERHLDGSPEALRSIQRRRSGQVGAQPPPFVGEVVELDRRARASEWDDRTVGTTQNLEADRVLVVPVVELDLAAFSAARHDRPRAPRAPAPPAREFGERDTPEQAMPPDFRRERSQHLREPAQPALGVPVDEGGLARFDLGSDNTHKMFGDQPRIACAGFEEQSLANWVDRNLEYFGESFAPPGEERQVVVADLEVGGILIAKLFERRVEARVPASQRCREADRRDR